MWLDNLLIKVGVLVVHCVWLPCFFKNSSISCFNLGEGSRQVQCLTCSMCQVRRCASVGFCGILLARCHSLFMLPMIQ